MKNEEQVVRWSTLYRTLPRKEISKCVLSMGMRHFTCADVQKSVPLRHASIYSVLGNFVEYGWLDTHTEFTQQDFGTSYVRFYRMTRPGMTQISQYLTNWD